MEGEETYKNYVIMSTADYYNTRLPESSVEYYEEYFSSDNVKVTLWWTNESQHSLVRYHVYVSPSSGVTTKTSFKRTNLIKSAL